MRGPLIISMLMVVLIIGFLQVKQRKASRAKIRKSFKEAGLSDLKKTEAIEKEVKHQLDEINAKALKAREQSIQDAVSE